MRGWAFLWLVACGARTEVGTVVPLDASPLDASIPDVSLVDAPAPTDASLDQAVDAPRPVCDVPTALATGQTPTALAVDATHVYWLNGKTFSRVPKQGGAVEVLASDDGSFTGQRILLDDQTVYGTQYNGGGGVWRVPKSGGSVSLLYGAPYPLGIAMDATTLYFASEYGGTLWSLPKVGGSPKVLAQADPKLASDIVDVATDGTKVYFTSWGGVFSVPNTGGPQERIVDGHDPRSIIVDGADLLFADATGSVWRLPNRKRPEMRLANVPIPHAIVADSSDVYCASLTWASSGGGIYRMDRQGKKSMRVVAQDNVRDVAVDDGCLYWATASGAIFKAAK